MVCSSSHDLFMSGFTSRAPTAQWNSKKAGEEEKWTTRLSTLSLGRKKIKKDNWTSYVHGQSVCQVQVMRLLQIWISPRKCSPSAAPQNSRWDLKWELECEHRANFQNNIVPLLRQVKVNVWHQFGMEIRFLTLIESFKIFSTTWSIAPAQKPKLDIELVLGDMCSITNTFRKIKCGTTFQSNTKEMFCYHLLKNAVKRMISAGLNWKKQRQGSYADWQHLSTMSWLLKFSASG